MRLVTTAAAGFGAVLLLAGCGGGSAEESGDSGGSSGSGEEATAFADESPETITAAVEEDMKALSSLRMAGELDDKGQQITIDLGLSTAGDCEGDLSVTGDASLELLSVDGDTWIKPSESFWQQVAGPAADQITAAAGDKWVAFPGDEADDFAEICDLDQLLEQFNTNDTEEEKVEVAGTEEVDGQEAVIVESTSDEGDPVKAWVAAEDPHHILQIEVDTGKEPGRLTFSDFDADLDLEAPASDDVFDLNAFEPTAP